jgi:hypothetical protein
LKVNSVAILLVIALFDGCKKKEEEEELITKTINGSVEMANLSSV